MPVLAGFGNPSLGNTSFALDLSASAAGSPIVMLIARGAASALLGSGCSLEIDPITLLASIGTASNEGGFASSPLPIPTSCELLGVQLCAQAVVREDGGPWNGLALPDGLHLVIGD